MRSHLLALGLAVSGLLLSGCQTPLVDEVGPLAIRSVTVTSKPTVTSQTDLTGPLQQAASASLVGGDPAGTPANVAISIDGVTYKNPMMSLLVGSTNALATTVSVSDETGRSLGVFPHSVLLDGAINGVVGAVVAASQDRVEVDRKLVERSASTLKVRIYGPPGHRPKVPAPGRVALPDVPATAAETAPLASPAAPSATPATAPSAQPDLPPTS